MTMIQQQSDAELVGVYARTRSDTAFAVIVRRHVNAVYAAAWRQVRDSSLAEDITQAVFVVLANRAHRMHDPRLLAGWLMKVTRYCAADARKLAARREFHEQRAAAMKPVISEDAMEPDIAEHLDAHLATLGAVDRAAIVLRCLEERSLAEVARELQMSEEAAKKRVARALEKLRKMFVRRGVTLSAVVLAGGLAKQGMAAPPTLATTICAAVGTKTAGSATAAILTKGALKMMAWTTAKMAVAATAGMIVVVGTTAAVVHVAASAPAATQEAVTVAPSEPEATTTLSEKPGFVYVMGQVKRPGVYQFLPGFTVRQLFRGIGVAPELASGGWVRLTRRVGANIEHHITVRIADFVAGVNVPPLARELQPNDMLNIGVDAPNAQMPSTGCVSILGDVRKAGSYLVFGRLVTTREAAERFAQPTAPLEQLIISVVGETHGQEAGQVIAQVKMADVLAGRSEDYFVCPGQTMLVFTVADNHMPPPAPEKKGLAIVPADKPATADGTFQMLGDVNRPGLFRLSGQKITIKMAAAAGNYDAAKNGTATLRRQVENGPEKVIEVNLKAIFEGTEADRFLQDGDVITVHVAK